LLRRQVERVLYALEDEVAGVGSVAVETQRRQGQCMSRVVGEVETALEAQFLTRRARRRNRDRDPGGPLDSWVLLSSACTPP